MKYCRFILCWVLLVSRGAQPATGHCAENRPLLVAAYHSPPFAMLTETGEPAGMSIEQWEMIAAHLGLSYEYRFTDMDGLILGMQKGIYDVGIGDIAVTPLREELLDFTHPLTISELGIAVPASTEYSIWQSFLLILSSLIKLTAGLVLLLLASGMTIWIVERRRTQSQFKPGLNGLGEGIWWAAVTMTTVGYGDKTPCSPLGRIIAIFWMFASIMLISFFTANASSIMTSARLHSPVGSVEDLVGDRIGVSGRSWGEEYLHRHGIRCLFQPDVLTALTALDSGLLDAVVAEVPVLKYLIHRQFGRRLHVTGQPVEAQYLAIALPPGSSLREMLNLALLRLSTQHQWKLIEQRYIEGRRPE